MAQPFTNLPKTLYFGNFFFFFFFFKIQRPSNEDVHLRQTVDPNDHVKSIEMYSRFMDITSEVGKFQTILEMRIFEKGVLDYILGMLQIPYQGMIYDVNTKEGTRI